MTSDIYQLFAYGITTRQAIEVVCKAYSIPNGVMARLNEIMDREEDDRNLHERAEAEFNERVRSEE